MTFNPTVFERLLFPLNRQAYRKIQDTLGEVERKHPGQLRRIVDGFSEAAKTDTQTAIPKPAPAGAVFPLLDIAILFGKPDDYRLSTLRKSTGYKIAFDYDEKPAAEFTGSHLNVSFYTAGKVLNSFIVPLGYLLGVNEKEVLKEGSYQLYSHTMLSPENQAAINRHMQNGGNTGGDEKTSALRRYQEKSLIYIGITKRTWQERYRQHCRDMGRGSRLLFHRALRGEMGRIGVIEHIVERAGLTEKQAMEMEEAEVERRSLHSLFPNGLNMIPGGYAGLKCVGHFADRTGYALQKELTADSIEAALVEVQRHALTKHFSTTDMERVNAEIARLWSEDISYRINVMTNRENRFSLRQIQAARTWHSSGWPFEKILACLKRLDAKKINMGQLERLLRGETYASIPEVLM